MTALQPIHEKQNAIRAGVPRMFAANHAEPYRADSARNPIRLTDPVGQPIRVGFVMHFMHMAGAEVLVREIIHRLHGLIEPTVICLDTVDQIGEELRAEGVRVEWLNRKPGRDYSAARRTAELIRERRIQVLHAHQYTPFFYAALARVLSLGRCRLILTEHGRHFPDVVSPLRRAANRLVLNQLASAINSCSAFGANALCRTDGFPGRRIEVIDNGIDLGRYAVPGDRDRLRSRLGLRADRRYVTCVARFHPVKDHVTLLRAFAGVADVRPDVDLLLAGKGPMQANVERFAAELQIVDRVRFLGVHSDVPGLLSASDVFALTSVTESASLTLMEAMATGIPIVATNVGGNPEFVRNEVDGLLFARGDWMAGTRAMLRVLDDPVLALKLGASARQQALARFDLNITIQRYFALYRRLAGRGGAE